VGIQKEICSLSASEYNVTSFDFLDLMKFIASIFLFSMHFKALNDFGNASFLLELMARWGVPFFFISSSFFLFSKSDNGNITQSTLIKYVQRIIRLYLFWFIVNLPYVVYVNRKNIFKIKAWLSFLKNALLSSTFLGSWFLVSCAFSACILYFASKKWKTGAIVFALFPLYMLCIFSSSYYGLLIPALRPVLNYLRFPLNIFNGCFFFALGKYISEYKAILCEKYTIKKSIIGVVFFYLLFFVEIYLCRKRSVFKTSNAAFSLVPISFFLFLLCIQITVQIKNHVKLRKLSTVIYCGQANVKCLWGVGEQYLHIGSYTLLYLVSVSIMAVICVVVLNLQKKAKWNWCKYIA